MAPQAAPAEPRARALDVIIFGATGFTGRLVAEVLAARSADGAGFSWAMAGRNPGKLAKVRASIGAPDSVALIEADADDPVALAALVAQTRVVITTVGPYQRHGEALINACAQAGTDYVDLCGEPVWMARMIPLLEAPARASGARIVFSCGFDSIPFDLGVVFLQAQAQRRFGQPLRQVHGRVRYMRGAASGGTVASLLATLEETGRDAEAARTLADPFALTPGFRGPPQPLDAADGDGAVYDELAKSWTGPFIMATINTKNVHRSNLLRGHPWGRDFEYDERLLLGDGAAGRAKAELLAGATWMQNLLLGFGPSRQLIGRLALPQPGQGPSRRQREAGSYDLRFTGQTADGRVLRATVQGDRDPGYGSTSRMIVEAALCLAQDLNRAHTPGGVWTAGAAMGLALVRRLEAHAGLRFSVED